MQKQYHHRREETAFMDWLSSPVGEVNSDNAIEVRADFIDEFVEALENFLKARHYTLGRNMMRFKRLFARWWYAMELAARTGKYVQYEKGARHRNHPYDYMKFMDVCDAAAFEPFIKYHAMNGFCDDETDAGEMTRKELKTFIYYNLDMANSPAREEIDEILREEEEIRRAREEANSVPSGRRVEYDVSELGTYRGDRVMS